MADKLNIQFRLKAVDNFSRVMGKLERELAKLQAASDALDLRHHGSITMDVDDANAKLDGIRDKHQTIHQDFDRALKPLVDTRDANRDLDDLNGRFKDIDKNINDADGARNGGGGNGNGGNNNNRNGGGGGSPGSGGDDDDDIDIGRIKNVDLAREAAHKEESKRIKERNKERQKAMDAALKSINDYNKAWDRAHEANKKWNKQLENEEMKAINKRVKEIDNIKKANDRVTAGVLRDVKTLERKVIRMSIDHAPAMKSVNEFRREMEHIRDNAENFQIFINATEGLREIDKLERRIDDLDRPPVPISAEAKNALREVDSVKRALDGINRKVVQLDINERDFLVGIQRVQRTLEYLETLNPTVEVDAEIAAARVQMNTMIALAHRLGAIDPSIDVDVDGFASAMARLQMLNDAADRVDRVSTVNVIVNGYKSFRRDMDRIATTGRNIGEIVTNMFMGTALAFSSILVPVIASTVGSIASIGVAAGVSTGALLGLASSLTAAGIGAGLYGTVAIPAIKKVTESASEIRDLQDDIDKAVAMGDVEGAKKKLDEMAYALAQLSEAERGAVTALNEFKDAHEGLVKKFEGKVFETFALALETTTALLERSEGIIGSVADAVQSLMESLAANLQSDDFNAFFAYLEKNAAPALIAITKAVGNFIMGFFNMMEAFGPLAEDMQNGLLDMSERFRDWAAALSESDKFQAFIDYTRENWPKVRAIIGKAITGIIKLFAAFAPYASEWMDRVEGMMDTFNDFAGSLSSNPEFKNFMEYMSDAMPKVNKFIGAFVKAIIAIGKAFAPVGLVMLDVGTYIFDLITNFQKANPEVATLMGWIFTLTSAFFALLPAIMIIKNAIGIVFNLFKNGGGMIKLFTGPIGIAIGILIGVFTKMWKESEVFRDIVMGAFESIKTNVSAAIDSVVSFVMEQWGKLTAYWDENGASIMEAAEVVWGFVETFINNSLKAILAIFEFVWPLIKGIVVGVWDAIKLVISGALDIILGLVSVFSGVFTGDWELVWEGIKQIFSGAFDLILGLLSLSFFGRMFKIAKGFFGAFGGSFSTLWTSIKGIFTTSITSVKSSVTNGFNSMRTFLDEIIGKIVGGITTGFRGAVSTVKNAWNELIRNTKEKFGNLKTGIYDIVKDIKKFFVDSWKTLKNESLRLVESIVAGIVGKFLSMAKGIGERLEWAWDIVTGFFKNVFDFLTGIDLTSVGSNIMSGLIKGIVKKGGDLFKKMGEIAGGLQPFVERIFGIKSPSRVFKTIGEMTMMGMIVGVTSKEREAVLAAQHAAQAMTAAFNPNMNAEMRVYGGSVKGPANNDAGAMREFILTQNIIANLSKMMKLQLSKAAAATTDYARKSAMAQAMHTQNSIQAVQDRYDSKRDEQQTIVVPVSIDGREVARATNRPLQEINTRSVDRYGRFTKRGGK